MADFEIAFKRTAKFEGGYTSDKDDPGNWTGAKVGEGELIGTNFGISAPELSVHLGRPATADEMKNLQQSLVMEIYKNKFWNIVCGDQIKNQDEANMIYDRSVNAGPRESIILTQRSLGITETGKMDNATLNALNA